MTKNVTLTKILAIVGTVLVWIPVLAPIFFSVVFFVERHEVRFDYLMPAELFLAFLFGGGLLFWAALQAHLHQRFIGWAYGSAVGLVVISQALAVVTGLASGDIETGGWQWVVVLTLLIIYSLAIVVTGVGGIMLLRDLFKPSQPETV